MAGVLTTEPASLDDIQYEVVDGQVVGLAPMGAYEGWLASRLLQMFASQQGTGHAVAEVLFDLTAYVGRKRRPDVAFVSYQRWPRHKPVPSTEAWDVVPNLAVEVISPSNSADEVLAKVAEYFRSGVEQVWTVFPRQRQIYVYTGPTEVTILGRADKLQPTTVLAGFELRLADLFGPEGEA